jgi:hypothetical protein
MRYRNMKTNKLIAEFMGYTKSEYDHLRNGKREIWCNDSIRKGHYYTPQEFKYHSSWDWLMPVVEKIWTITGHRSVHWLDVGEIVGKFSTSITIWPDDHEKFIDQVYSLVVNFIKWYNENKPNETSN